MEVNINQIVAIDFDVICQDKHLVDGAWNTIANLKKLGFHIVICTYQDTKTVTSWLDRNNLDCEVTDRFFPYHYHWGLNGLAGRSFNEIQAFFVGRKFTAQMREGEQYAKR